MKYITGDFTQPLGLKVNNGASDASTPSTYADRRRPVRRDQPVGIVRSSEHETKQIHETNIQVSN